MNRIRISSIYPEGRYRSGDLDLDIDRRRLAREGCHLQLSKLTFELLKVLISAAPTVVTKEELIDLVWAGRVVNPETVTQRVKLLRDALGDDAHDPRYVELIHGHGYRWIPTVESVSPEPPTNRSIVRTPVSNREDIGQFLGNPESPHDVNLELPSDPSVVILPFDMMGDDKQEHRIVADGLTHDIITCVGRTRWLFVVARGTAFMFRGGMHDVREVSSKLGVRYVVQGNVGFSGHEISVNVALADAVGGDEIWAEHFRGTIDDIFDIQDEISNLVVRSVEAEIEHAEQKRALLVPPTSLDAWNAYHLAWWHLNSLSEDCCDQADHFFKLSSSLDPDFARPLAGLSSVHWVRAFMEISSDREREIQKALELAHQSLTLDPNDPLAHWALGRAFQLRQDFPRSIEEFEVSVDLNPNFALGRLYHAFVLTHVGENSRSNEMLGKAHRLSPYDPWCYAMLGMRAINEAMMGHYDEAADLSVRGAELLAWHCQMFPVVAAYCNILAERKSVAREYYNKLQDSRPGYNSSNYFRAYPHQRNKDVATISGAFEALEQIR